MRQFKISAPSIIVLGLSVAGASGPAAARGQIYVSNFDTGNLGEYGLDGTVINASLISGSVQNFTMSGGNFFTVTYNTLGEYTASGVPVNASLVTGLGHAYGIALSGPDIFVGTSNTTNGNDTVSEYTTSGSTVKAPLINGLDDPLSVVVSGQYLFVASYNAGSIGEYTLSGPAVNANLITGLTGLSSIAISGSELYVACYGGEIGKYTLGAAPGTIVSSIPSLISGLNSPFGVAVFENDLYLTFAPGDVPGSGWIGVYGTDGTTVNPDLITGLTTPSSIVVVPEPAAGSTFPIAGIVLLLRRPPSRG